MKLQTKSVFPAVLFIFGVLFILADIVFLFFNKELFDIFNLAVSYLPFTKETPHSIENFWLILANAYMCTIAFLAIKASLDVDNSADLIIALLIAKISSAAAGLAFFFLERYISYLILFVVDFGIFLILLYFYHLHKKSFKLFK